MLASCAPAACLAFFAGWFALAQRSGLAGPLYVRGYSLPVACGRLGIASGTGDTHLKRIYRKLGVHSRAELIDLAAGEAAPPADA